MSNLYSQIQENIFNEFCNFRKTAAKNLSLISLSMLDSGSFSTHQIATSMSKMLAINFRSENRLSRFLATKSLEIGAKNFRTCF